MEQIALYLPPLLLSVIFRITEAWYLDSKSENPSKSFNELWLKIDQDIAFGTVITISAYFFLPIEAYKWIAEHYNLPNSDQWTNFMMAFIGVYALPLYKKIKKNVKH